MHRPFYLSKLIEMFQKKSIFILIFKNYCDILIKIIKAIKCLKERILHTMEKLNVAVIGLGGRGRSLLKTCLKYLHMASKHLVGLGDGF